MLLGKRAHTIANPMLRDTQVLLAILDRLPHLLAPSVRVDAVGNGRCGSRADGPEADGRSSQRYGHPTGEWQRR
jgi:hypothetical protein